MKIHAYLWMKRCLCLDSFMPIFSHKHRHELGASQLPYHRAINATIDRSHHVNKNVRFHILSYSFALSILHLTHSEKP